ncbi:glycosyltransferase family 4 protein [Ferruginibacter sp. HRS2-29]|uniref:glycosyltransferase family 4 protein n=1 Tax=Ferruginibacter sp. HRS2-29 TaxID=2487334 RepID=UPI0020CD6628|nr:glycosyltransferase family 4 protein [Ferruginibacter sp. HRS2-29]MCP9749930.1 glycosyltransferase family 1 protein [Ferruginibacter sp. HRS2-29]
MKRNIAIIENHVISANTVRKKLINELMTKGYNVTILTTGSEKDLALAAENGFTVIDVKTSNTNIGDIYRYIRNIRSALKSGKIDICLTFTMRPAIWGNIITRIMGIPTITNITGIGPLAESSSLTYRIARTLYKFVLLKTAKVFFQNKDDRDVFLAHKFVKQEVTELIPGSGVDYDYYAPVEDSGKPHKKFVFLYIGRLIKDKGITEYVDAGRILKTKLPNVEVQALGPYYSQNLKENTITERDILKWVEDGIITYLGASYDVRSYIAKADCIVLPSYREGMSNVLLEAASMEKPTIACDTTGCRDIIDDGETGYLVKVRDVEDLVEKMQKMTSLSVEERKVMGKKAREKVKRSFGKNIVIAAYFKAIEEILKKKK